MLRERSTISSVAAPFVSFAVVGVATEWLIREAHRMRCFRGRRRAAANRDARPADASGAAEVVPSAAVTEAPGWGWH